MPKGVEARINHRLLSWARESAGYSLDQIAKKTKISRELLESCERGEQYLSVPQLRKIAKTCRRHLACFFLPDIPDGGFQPLKDFRRHHGVAEFHDSVPLGFEIRDAEDRRITALELIEELGEKPSRFGLSTQVSEAPEAIAQRARKFLGISWEAQRLWRDSNEAFNRWRAAVEQVGALVFQMSSVNAAEVRGLSIAEFPLPVILLNTDDHEHGRIFTLAHELAHLMLRQGGICDLREDAEQGTAEQVVEVFCNAVAGAMLAPREDFVREREQFRNSGRYQTLDDLVGALASRFKVSREMILRRHLTFGLISDGEYREKREQYRKEYAALRERKKAKSKESKSGFAPPSRLVLSNLGIPFTRLVLNGYGLEKITGNDVSDFLGIKLHHLPRVEAELTAKVVKYGRYR